VGPPLEQFASAPIEMQPVTVRGAPEISIPPQVVASRAPARAVAAAPRNADPYGVKDARSRILGTYDKEAAGVDHVAGMQEKYADLLAKKRQFQADEREDDAAAMAKEQAKADADFEAKFQEAQRQLDDVRAKKVDPTRYMQDAGVGVMSVLGGVLGGIYQGLNRMEKNPFLENLNKQIDRDIAAQQMEIDNARAGVGDKLNLLSQQRAVFKDSQLAKLQARNMYYEAAKEQLAADAANYEGRIEAERARLGIQALEREQQGLKKAWGEQAQKLSSAQAAAGIARARDERKELRQAFLGVYEKGIAAGLPPEQAEIEAERAVQTLFMGGAGARPQTTGAAPLAKHDAEALEKLSKELSKPEIVNAKKTIDGLEAKLSMTDPKTGRTKYNTEKGLPGVGPGADLREAIGKRPTGARQFDPTAWALHGAVGLNDEERVTRQEWQRLGLAYRHAITGAGGSDAEAKMIQEAFAGANTPAEQANAVRIARETLSEQESRIKAGFNDRVVR
jgi:hypothetical protein